MAKQNQHVVPYGSQWAVKGAGNARATSVQDTQTQAIAIARQIAMKRRVEVVIHRPNGTIRDKDSYGRDPMPPRDRRF